MNIDAYQVRRATTDDLPQLSELWKAAQFPLEELEKRLIEFQIAVSATGEVVACVGLQIAGTDGRIHSEWFADFALSEDLRSPLWDRLQLVAANHGLFRLWTDESAPFWKKGAGFSAPTNEVTAKLPPDFGDARGGWVVLRLKDESADPNLLDAQFAMFRDAEKVKRDKLLQRANVIKVIGTGIAVLLFLSALATLVWFVHHRQ